MEAALEHQRIEVFDVNGSLVRRTRSILLVSHILSLENVKAKTDQLDPVDKGDHGVLAPQEKIGEVFLEHLLQV